MKLENRRKIMSDVRSLFCFDVMCWGRTSDQFVATYAASIHSIPVSCSKEGLTRVLGRFNQWGKSILETEFVTKFSLNFILI
jgi:hypothetical protein